MKRRDFLKTSVVAGAALSIDFTGLQAALSSNTMAVEQAPEMVAVMGGEPEVMLDKALETLGGIGKYIKKGQKVVIKPNIGWDRTPELAGNTNPGLIKALVKKCLEAGAEKVTVFDHTCDNWQKCYESSGIAAAVNPEEPRRSETVVCHEELYGYRLGPPFLPSERLATMYRRHLHLAEETGIEHCGCLPYDASERTAG